MSVQDKQFHQSLAQEDTFVQVKGNSHFQITYISERNNLRRKISQIDIEITRFDHQTNSRSHIFHSLSETEIIRASVSMLSIQNVTNNYILYIRGKI